MSEHFTSSDRSTKGLRRHSREVKGITRRIFDEFDGSSTSIEVKIDQVRQTGGQEIQHDSHTTMQDMDQQVIQPLSKLQQANPAQPSVMTLMVGDRDEEARPASPSLSSASMEEDNDAAIILQLQKDILDAINAESRSRLASVLEKADPSLCLQALLSFAHPNRDLKYHHDPEVQHDADELLGRSVANLNALHIACFLGEEELACDLLDYVARVTKAMGARKVLYEFLGRVWGGGNTALHLASFCGMAALVRRLLELGANMNKRNERKYKAVDCADDDATRKLFLDMMQGTGE
jgi:hypothetical protein